MATNILTCMKTLARAKTIAHACQLFFRDFEPLGEDAIEAVPLFIGKLVSLRGRAGENGLACLCYKGYIEIPDSLGTQGQTVAVISVADKMIRNLISLIVPDMQTVVIGIRGSMERGAYAAEAIPHLTQFRKRLAARQSDDADRPQTGLQGVAAAPITTLIGHVDSVIHAAQDASRSHPALTKAAIGAFVGRAMEDRSTVLIKTSQICALVESLASGIHRVRPRLASEELMEQAMTATRLQCPACGTFTPEAVRHLYLAAKSGFKPGSVGNCVIFPGKKAASVAAGRCPGCQVAALICTFDPFAIELQQTSWRRLISLMPKIGK
jgi:hypothetical protein